jgi:hypothetical protein
MLGTGGNRLARGLAEGFELSLRAAALPWMLGLRWAGGLGGPSREGLPAPARSLALALKVAADELFFAAEVVCGALAVRAADRRRVAREVEAAHSLFLERGWLARPETFHRTPPPLATPSERDARGGRRRYRHLSFASGFEPHAGVPGRARWLRYAPNRTAHAWLLRHDGAPRPWVVCVPGFRMGQPLLDFAGFRAGWLHRELGLNVAIAVLPFHGPRRVGRRSGDGYLSGDFLDTLHAQTQAIWDLRRLVGWLRREGAPAIGAYGLSLGSYTVSLLAALEPGLDCAVAGIPASCFVGLARNNVPRSLLALAERTGFPFERIEELLRVVSPLALRPLLPRERCFIYAGTADRLAPPAQALDLWEHWSRPRLVWYDGSHVSFFVEPAVPTLLREAFGAEAWPKRRAACAARVVTSADTSLRSPRRAPPLRARAVRSPLPMR